MTPIEILATIFAVLVLFKLILSITNPKLRVKIAESFISTNTAVMIIVFLALTAIVGYYMLSSLTIVEVAAAMLFMSGLMGIFFIQYKGIMLKLLRESLKSREEFLRKNWLTFLIWAAIAVWVLYVVFS